MLPGVCCATEIILLLSLVLSMHVLVMYLITIVYACALTIVLKTGMDKEPEKRLITGFMVRPGSDRWSNR